MRPIHWIQHPGFLDTSSTMETFWWGLSYYYFWDFQLTWESSNCWNRSWTWRIHFLCFCSMQKGWVWPNDFQLEKPKKACAMQPFQSGYLAKCSEFDEAKLLYGLNRFEGRLLLCPYCILAPKVPDVWMGREAVSIYLFSKWVSLLSSKIYQTYEANLRYFKTAWTCELPLYWWFLPSRWRLPWVPS